MQEGKGIFINNNLNKNYTVGEKQTGWTRQGKAGRDTRHTMYTVMNQHGTANHKEILNGANEERNRGRQVGQINQ